MLIYCTKKLLNELEIKPDSIKSELPLFSWHANLFTFNNRKAIVLVNDSNRYIIVLYGLRARDMKNLDDIIMNSIRRTLLDEYIKAEIVEKFINQSPRVVYSKTKDRSLVARLNKACETIGFYVEEFSHDTINQSDVSIRASASLVGDGNDGYFSPNEVMYADLEIFAKEPIFKCKSVEFKVTLGLENHDVWRRIVVPYDISFKKLHDILQIVFDWKNHHMHEFLVFDGNNPVVDIVCSKDIEHTNDLPVLFEKDVRLSKYIPQYSRIKYIYDFGDAWQHYIEVEKIIEDYTKNYPECIAGMGNTPPEDVGGEAGYDDFLEAISDQSHPEHKSMVDWAKGQWYRDFNIELVNRRLKVQ